MRKQIMTVDDSASVRQMVSFVLKNVNYEIIEAVDGKDALAKMKDASIHMLIADVNMPNMGGIELTRAVRAGGEHKFIPIIMLTTEFHETKKDEGREAGATGWIVKPFRPEQLLAVVRKVLG